MSPLVTILVIMLLTVVYNESQYIAEYQDEYEKIVPKNMRPFELCDEGLRKCKTTNIWRELLKNTDVLFDDAHDFSRDYTHDYVEEEETQKIGQKRNFPFKVKKDCQIVQTDKDPRPDSEPRVIVNITCDYEANKNLTLPAGWSCQPVEYRAKVMSRKARDSATKDVSGNCWLYRKIPIHKSRALSKHSLDDDTNDIPAHLKGCWKIEDKYIHVGCRLKFVG